MLIKSKQFKEGEFFCKWLQSRLLVKNKNVLGAELGPTGSGKSYRDLRKVELWYRDYLKRPFPTENICFGTALVMQRLASGEMKKGDVIIFEEAGANLGSLDFQNKVSKMFTYVLQSFRSMNVAIFFNLPYLSMLNKQARMLLHYSSESAGIDFNNNINKAKFFFHQVNQATGKVYKKSPRGKVNGRTRKIKKFGWSLPNSELISLYERKKALYLSKISEEYAAEMRKMEEDKIAKMERPLPTHSQLQVKKLLDDGKKPLEIASIMNQTPSNVYQKIRKMRKNGIEVEY